MYVIGRFDYATVFSDIDTVDIASHLLSITKKCLEYLLQSVVLI